MASKGVWHSCWTGLPSRGLTSPASRKSRRATPHSRTPPIEAAGYHPIWHGQPRHHGVAVLARQRAPVNIRRGLPGDDSDGQARYLEAGVGELRVASVYMPNGNPVGSDTSNTS